MFHNFLKRKGWLKQAFDRKFSRDGYFPSPCYSCARSLLAGSLLGDSKLLIVIALAKHVPKKELGISASRSTLQKNASSERGIVQHSHTALDVTPPDPQQRTHWAHGKCAAVLRGKVTAGEGGSHRCCHTIPWKFWTRKIS